MKVNITSLIQSLSSLGFVWCFCIFLIYHLGIYNGYWVGFFPNYFGVFIGLFFLIYSISFFRIYEKFLYLNIGFLFPLVFIFSYSLIVTIINFENKYTFYQSIEYLIMFFTLFIMGFYLTKPNWLLSKNLFIYLLILIFLLILNSSLFQGRFSISVFNEEVASGYQTIARNFLAFFLMGYCLLFNSKINLIYFLVMVVSLFLIGARSEFIVFLLVIFLVLLLESLKYKKINYILIISFMVLLFFSLNSSSIDSRQLQLIDIENSSSWEARSLLTDRAIQTISHSWFYGEFGSHIEDNSNVGRYSHNLLSGYVNYGVVYFILYIYILVFIFIKSFFIYWENPNWMTRYSFILNLICFILLIFAKPIFWPMTYLAWGFFAGTCYVNKINSKNI